MNLGKTVIKIGENSIEDFNVEYIWNDPHLWTLDDPYLYYMHIVLLDAGVEIDRKIVRFGFREVWSEGYKFYLNGTRINLRGDSWHFQGTVQQTKEYALNWFSM